MAEPMGKYPLQAKVGVPHELAVVLNGPIGPQRLRDDTIIFDQDGWYRTLTPSAACSTFNDVVFCNLDKQDPDRHIDAIFAEYYQRGLPFTWSVYPWSQPNNLGERLQAHGGRGIKVKAYLGSTALPLVIVEGVKVVRVDPTSLTDGIDAYLNILAPGYALSSAETAFRRQLYQQLCAEPKPVMHLFIARCNGVIAGCSGMVIKTDSGSAHMTSASVLPQFQARGVFQSLIAASLADLRDMGITLATGHSNLQSAFWVERFGFKCIYEYELYELEPPA